MKTKLTCKLSNSEDYISMDKNINSMKAIKIITLIISILAATVSYGQRKIVNILPPLGYQRVESDAYGSYLRSLPLKPYGTPVKLHDGRVKSYQDGAYAVIDMEIGNRDLQQCADAVMRLRAEYLWHSRQYDKIHFNFTSGFRADYVTWAKGYRVKVNGNNVSWYKAAEEDYSYEVFRKYMDIVFMYAGTASLSKELVKVNVNNLKVGDVFIVGGHPGHAMIIIDLATDKLGNKAIMVAQSYMPAQDIHIVTNLSGQSRTPWYIINDKTTDISFPEFHFRMDQIKRFKNE